MLGICEEKQGPYGWNWMSERKSTKKWEERKKQRIGLLRICGPQEKNAIYSNVKDPEEGLTWFIFYKDHPTSVWLS